MKSHIYQRDRIGPKPEVKGLIIKKVLNVFFYVIAEQTTSLKTSKKFLDCKRNIWQKILNLKPKYFLQIYLSGKTFCLSCVAVREHS